MNHPIIVRKGFTLLELLIVVAIMALLLGLSIPAFQGIGQGSRLRSSIFQLKTTLNLTRQTAITTRQEVCLLLPGKTINYTTNNIDLAFSSYAVYARRDADYVGEWRKLPPGLIFSDAEKYELEPLSNIFLERDTSGSRFYVNLPFETKTGRVERIACITIRPDGGLFGSIEKGIYISEGWLDAATKTPVTKPESFLYGLEIQALTAQSTLKRYPEDEL